MLAQAQLLRIFYGTTDIRRWQNYSLNNSLKKTFTATKKFRFMPFDLPGATETALIGSSSVTLTTPATTDNNFVFSYGLEQGYLCEIETYQFDSSVGDDVVSILPTSAELLSTFTGQVESVKTDLKTLEILIGTTEFAVAATVPPRVFTNYLVGVPYSP